MLRTPQSHLLLALALLSATATSQAVPITPAGYGDVAGNSDNCIPFCAGYGNRYQQVFDAVAFGGASGLINSLAFRLDETDFVQAGLPWDPLQPNASFENLRVDLIVTLAYTATTSQTISPEFADNNALAPINVFSGSVYWSTTQLAGNNPNPFDLVIDVDNTFFYDGLQNLMLDITILNQSEIQAQLGTRRYLDAAWNPAPFGRAYGSSDGTGANGFSSVYGLITQFDLEPIQVPEPSSVALFGVALIGLAARRKRRRVN